MKSQGTSSFCLFSAASLTLSLMSLRAQTALPTTTNTPPLNWQATARDGVSTTWEATEQVTNAVTGVVTTTPHRYVEVASGLNFTDQSGQWQVSQDLIELTPNGGAAAVHGPHQVYFSPNLNRAGALTIVTTSNRVFKTRPLGLYYYDAASGKSVLLASVHDSAGELLPPNQVVYKSAFDSLQADLRYTYTKAAFESDVVLLQKPKPPEAYGLDPKTTRLEVWHEWLNAPTPKQKLIVLGKETDPAVRSRMVEPDFTDALLDFGDVWFPRGCAFAWNGAADRPTNTADEIRVPDFRSADQVPTAKKWFAAANRSILVESVLWQDIQPRLAGLPQVAQGTGTAKPKDRLVCLRELPPPNTETNQGQAIKLASARYHPAGFVLDYLYITVPSSWNTYDYSFDTGTTYLVSSSTYFSSRVIFQPGCFIKFANNAYLLMYGSIVCNGSSSSRSILTSQDDDWYGYGFTWSSHWPNYAAGPAIWDYYIQANVAITGMEIRWAHTGIEFDGSGDPYCNGYPDCCGQTNTVTDCTLEFCETGILVKSCVAKLATSTMCGVANPTASAWTCQWCPPFDGSLTDICNGSENGLPYLWEYQWFDHLGVATNGDADGDCLSNLQEYQLSTNPTHGNPPVVSSAPVGKLVFVGQSATFSVAAYNTCGITYQWYLNSKTLGNRAIPGATNASYTRTAVQVDDDGEVTVEVYNRFGDTPATVALVVPDTIALAVWTNYVAHTNGKTMNLWATRTTNNPPALAWDQSCIFYGMTNFTAISQRNSFDLANGGPGVCAVTALTRRHGYMRGHGNGSGGYQGNTNLIGQTVWFCPSDSSQPVAATIYSSLVRCRQCNAPYNNADYGIVLFNSDLSQSITPMAVMTQSVHMVVCLSPCQHGLLSANVPPFSWRQPPFWQPDRGLQAFPFNTEYTQTNGDSGSPDMVPVPEADGSTSLVMISGRTTDGPSALMQGDMDSLITNYNSEHGYQPGDPRYLDTNNIDYRLRWHQ